jgi:hypothetical protein
VLLNLGSVETQAVVSIAATSTPDRVALTAPFARTTGAAGSLVLPVIGADGARLRVRGSNVWAYWLDAAGRLSEGRSFDGATGGMLTVRHGPGPVAVWLERADQTPFSVGRPTDLRLPAVAALSGTTRSYAVGLNEPTLLVARTQSPVLASIRGAGLPPATELFAQGLDHAWFLPRGRAELHLRSALDSPLGGKLELATRPARQLVEGLGPDLVLAPGSRQLFRVDVERRGAIGFGVRADPDVVTARAFDARGRELGSGVTQIHNVDPGSYFLLVEAPSTAPPIRLRPAVVGLNAPSNEPPGAVRQSYLDLVGSADAPAR